MKAYLKKIISCFEQEENFVSRDWYEIVVRKSLTQAFDNRLADFISEEYVRVFMDDNISVKNELEDVHMEALKIFQDVAVSKDIVEVKKLKCQNHELEKLEQLTKELRFWQFKKRFALYHQIGNYALVEFKDVMLILQTLFLQNKVGTQEDFYFVCRQAAEIWLKSMKENF